MTTPEHIYIAGPMRKHRGYNFPAFFKAEANLTEQYPDAEIVNPARMDLQEFDLEGSLRVDPTGMTAGRYLAEHPDIFDADALKRAMQADLTFVTTKADLVVLLPGWEESKGANAEKAAAEAVGVEVVEMQRFAAARDDKASLYSDDPGERDPAVEGWVAAVSGMTLSPRDFIKWTESATAILRDALERAGIGPAPQNSLSDDGEFDWPSLLAEPGLGDETFGPPEVETRVTSETGGEKGQKLQAFDQVSPEIELLVAEHFGKGARKYEAHNFRRGYPWSLSYSALRRHLAAFWSGKEYDRCPEDGYGCKHTDRDGKPFHTGEPATCFNHTGSLHIVAAVWHTMVLAEFSLHRGEYDDRYSYER